MRRRARRDANHNNIVGVLRAIGCKVWDCAAMGGGFPDLLVMWRGRIVLLEIKDGDKPPSARKLTDDQVFFHAEWKDGPLAVVSTAEEAIAAMQKFTRDR